VPFPKPFAGQLNKYLVRPISAAKQIVENSDASAAPEGATENGAFAVCLKAYPDYEPSLIRISSDTNLDTNLLPDKTAGG
jgi:hypothetical protein